MYHIVFTMVSTIILGQLGEAVMLIGAIASIVGLAVILRTRARK